MRQKRSRSVTAAVAAVLLLGGTFVQQAQASEPFLGQIQTFGFGFAPRGWATCEGQLMPISQNSALFALLGTTFGGDGRTTFALPDMRGRAAIGQGNGPGLTSRSWGLKSGQQDVTLTIQQMPSHNHLISARGGRGTTTSPADSYLAVKSRNKQYGDATPTVTMADDMVGNAGGGQSHNNMPPFLVLYFCIATQGIFPSRDN
jgi:microcystin-dependent protein